MTFTLQYKKYLTAKNQLWIAKNLIILLSLTPWKIVVITISLTRNWWTNTPSLLLIDQKCLGDTLLYFSVSWYSRHRNSIGMTFLWHFWDIPRHSGLMSYMTYFPPKNCPIKNWLRRIYQILRPLTTNEWEFPILLSVNKWHYRVERVLVWVGVP